MTWPCPPWHKGVHSEFSDHQKINTHEDCCISINISKTRGHSFKNVSHITLVRFRLLSIPTGRLLWNTNKKMIFLFSYERSTRPNVVLFILMFASSFVTTGLKWILYSISWYTALTKCTPGAPFKEENQKFKNVFYLLCRYLGLNCPFLAAWAAQRPIL